MIVAVIPAAWILIQALPLPIQSLEHPIWLSAQTALGKSLWGSISISPGAALVSLARYLTACGLFFVAAAVSIDRQRAETMLFWLAGIATALAALRTIHDLGGFLFLGEISSIGRAPHLPQAPSWARFSPPPWRCLRSNAMKRAVAAAISVSLLRYYARVGDQRLHHLLARDPSIHVESGDVYRTDWCRNLRAHCRIPPPRPRTQHGIRACGRRDHRAGLARRPRPLLANAPDLTLRFDTEEARPIITLTQRIIADTTWFGSGAGTFSALLPIYSDTPNAMSIPVAPTTAAEILVDLGRPALWLITIGGLAAVIWLIHGALARGRDSFYPAAGASCAIVLLLEAYFDASLLTSTTIVLATASWDLRWRRASAARPDRQSELELAVVPGHGDEVGLRRLDRSPQLRIRRRFDPHPAIRRFGPV